MKSISKITPAYQRFIVIAALLLLSHTSATINMFGDADIVGSVAIAPLVDCENFYWCPQVSFVGSDSYLISDDMTPLLNDIVKPQLNVDPWVYD